MQSFEVRRSLSINYQSNLQVLQKDLNNVQYNFNGKSETNQIEPRKIASPDLQKNQKQPINQGNFKINFKAYFSKLKQPDIGDNLDIYTQPQLRKMLDGYLQYNPEYEKLKQKVSNKQNFKELFSRKHCTPEEIDFSKTTTHKKKYCENLTQLENQLPIESKECLNSIPKIFHRYQNSIDQKHTNGTISRNLIKAASENENQLRIFSILKTKLSTYDSNQMKPSKSTTKKNVVFALDKMNGNSQKKTENEKEKNKSRTKCLCC